MDPGFTGFGGEVEPEGVVEVDAGMFTAIGAWAEGLGVEAGDEMLDAIDFIACKTDVEHGTSNGRNFL